MKVVVTGGAGFIGAHLTRALLAVGHEVIVFDSLYRASPLARGLSEAGAQMITGDVRDLSAVRAAIRGSDLVFHLAAQSNVMGAEADRAYALATNVLGTQHVLQAGCEEGVQRVIFTSSREVYGDTEGVAVTEDTALHPKNTYGSSKAHGEQLCLRFRERCHLDVNVLRLANVYGPGDSGRVIPLWVERVVRGDDLVVYGGAQVIDFISVELAVRALLRASELSLGGQAVNVGSGVGTTLSALAQRLQSLASRRVQLHVLPAREVEVTRFVADVTRMGTLLGILPPADPLADLARLLEEPVHSFASRSGRRL